MAGRACVLDHLSPVIGCRFPASLNPACSWLRIAIVIYRAWFGRYSWQPRCRVSGGREITGLFGRLAPLFLSVIPLFVLFGLGVLTWKQTEIWHDSERLWSHALAVSPSGMANLHVGRFVAQRGDLAEAEKHLRRAVEINPKNDVFQSNLALILARQGNLAEATKHFRRALEINPDDPATLNNMGITLAQQGKLDEAILHFQRSLEIKPNDASGHTNMANLLLDRGDVDGATEHLARRHRNRSGGCR